MSYTIYDILTRLEKLDQKEVYLAYLRQLRSGAVSKANPCAIVMVNKKLSDGKNAARAVSFGDD